jgi:cytochrome c553
MVQRTLSSFAGTVAALALLGAMLGDATAQSAKEKAEPCIACHGEGGNSQIDNVPSLAGQPAKYLLIQLILFRDKQRVVETMTPFAEKLTDEDVQDLAAYFAEQKLLPDPELSPAEPALIAQGQKLADAHHCSQCHLPNFAGREQMARLAGQREDYLLNALNDFKAGERPGLDGTMAEAVYNLKEDDFKVLAHFLAHRRSD